MHNAYYTRQIATHLICLLKTLIAHPHAATVARALRPPKTGRDRKPLS
jgi:hypothetical protein